MASTREWFETVAEAQRRARKRLPRSVYLALVAGTEQGHTLRDNVDAFGELGFRPRIADTPQKRSQTTTIMGQEIDLPVLISPTGVQAVHPEGEVAVARVAAVAGTAMGLSSFASRSIEDVAAVNPKTFFQTYWVDGRDAIAHRAERARTAGAAGLIITLDWSFATRRDWGSPAIPEKMDLTAMLRFAPEALTRPRYRYQWARSGTLPDLTTPSLAEPGQDAPTFFGAYGQWMTTPLPTWDDIAWLREQWAGPFMGKGSCTPTTPAARSTSAPSPSRCPTTAATTSTAPGLDLRPARHRRRRRIPGRGAPRRRHPPWRPRGQGNRSGREGGPDRAGLLVGHGRRRRGRGRERAVHPAQRHRRGPARGWAATRSTT
jgi:isopentenyl diphosphate isomerase/L-lactate dehydrogenase-like FMN-dependent dehydrogenase